MTKFWIGLLVLGFLLMVVTGMFWLPMAAITASGAGIGYELGRKIPPRQLER